MKAKKLITLGEELDINISLISSELDTDPNRLRYFSNQDKELSPYEISSFKNTFNDIKENGDFITSLNDNSELFEYGDENTIVILYSILEQNLIIVDTEDVKVIRAVMKEFES